MEILCISCHSNTDNYRSNSKTKHKASIPKPIKVRVLKTAKQISCCIDCFKNISNHGALRCKSCAVKLQVPRKFEVTREDLEN